MKNTLSTLDNVTFLFRDLQFNQELSAVESPLANDALASGKNGRKAFSELDLKMSKDPSMLLFYKRSVTTESILTPGKTFQDKSIGWKGGPFQKRSYDMTLTSKKGIYFFPGIIWWFLRLDELRDVSYDEQKKPLTATSSADSSKAVYTNLSDAHLQSNYQSNIHF